MGAPDSSSSPGAGAAYVFQRIPGSQAWQETARLRGDTNAASFGASVAVSGTTIVVGAPDPTGGVGPGFVFVFEEDEDGEGAWGEVARLAGEPPPVGVQNDAFGRSVSIDADTVIVGAHRPAPIRLGSEAPLVYVYSRGGSGMNAWSLEAILPLRTVAEGGLASVAISGDTVAAGAFSLSQTRLWFWRLCLPARSNRAECLGRDRQEVHFDFRG